jgi:Domain of unknown function (DUF1737)
MRYLIIESQDATKMQTKVNQAIIEGWQPLGGLSVVNSISSGTWWYFQAVVHHGKESLTPHDDLA